MMHFVSFENPTDYVGNANFITNAVIDLVHEHFRDRRKCFMDEVKAIKVYPSKNGETYVLCVTMQNGQCREEFSEFLRDTFGQFRISLVGERQRVLILEFVHFEQTDFFKGCLT